MISAAPIAPMPPAQHLSGAHEREIGDRRREQRAPEPDSAANEPETLLDSAQGGLDVLRARMGRRAHQEHRDRGRAERRSVDGERGSRAEGGHQHPAQRGTRQTKCDRPNELIERVGRREVGRRDDVRDDRFERRREEGGADAVESDDDQ